jgi:tRNA threonylcarbamoyladenosine biosynthesis protein TsaB
MKLLGLDTSTEYLSLALWQDGDLLARGWRVGQQHAELALPYLQQLLQDAGLTLADLDAFAFGHGPGGFTGLRIGCGLIQGLAWGCNKPVLGINSLLATAAYSGATKVLVAQDARMQEVYHACYIRQDNGTWLTHTPPAVSKPALLALPDGDDWLGAGSGFAAYPELVERMGPVLRAVDPAAYPHASAIVTLAAPALAAGQGVPAAEADLVYVRDKVALKSSERHPA